MKRVVTAVYRYTAPWSTCVLQQAVGSNYSYSIKVHHLICHLIDLHCGWLTGVLED